MGPGLVKPHCTGRRVLSLVLVCVMVWSLLPQRASALKPLCGIEAHEHTRACYAVSGGRELACDYMKYVHTHGESCYGSDGSLICMTADFVLHKHDESCYDSDGNLICPLEERDESVHGLPDYDSHPDATCIYVPYFGHVHSDACYRTETRLVCGIEAGSGGHVHDGNCYERRLTCGYDDTGDDMAALVDTEHEPDSDGDLAASDGAEAAAGNTPAGTAVESGVDAGAGGDGGDGDLIDAGEPGASGDDESDGQDGGAGIPEVPAAHVHDGSCWSDVLVCDQDEGGHVHGESCYETERVLACPYADSGNDDGAVSDGNTCVHYVYEEHVHDGSCYDGQGNIICGKWELKRHEHNSTCFRDIVESYGDELTCGKQEHTHSLKCYYDDETSPLGRFVTAYESFDSGIKSGRWDLVSDAGEIAGEAYVVRALSEGLDREILGMSETKDMLANLEKYIPDGFEPAAPEEPVEPDAGGNLNSDRSGAVLSVPVSHVARPDVVDESDESAGFVFGIELSDGDASGASVPEDATCRVSGSGEGWFGDIIFTAPGEYAFDVRALSGGSGTCRLDGRTFRVRATVTEAVSDGLSDADGSPDEAPDASVKFDVSVSYSVIGDDGSETSVDSISFESVDAVRAFLDAVAELRAAMSGGESDIDALAGECAVAMEALTEDELALPEVQAAIAEIGDLVSGSQDSFEVHGGISWGSVTDDGVLTDRVSDDTSHWDVSNSAVRNLHLPVAVNLTADATDTWLKITVPMRILGVVRYGDAPRLDIAAGVSGNCTTVISDDGSTVTMTYTNTDGSGLHVSRILMYTVDCWRAVSGSDFVFPCQVETSGGAVAEYNLIGRITTGFGMTVGNYTAYNSFAGFGGSDLDNAYVNQWNESYETWFGLDRTTFNSDTTVGYVYDVASFLVQPTGNQPYDIHYGIDVRNGTCEGAVYMMDPRGNPESVFVRGLTDNTIPYDSVVRSSDGTPAVVSGNLSDSTDGKTYVLYFLCRFRASDVTGSDGRIGLYADFTVEHQGVGSDVKVSDRKTNVKLYEGGMASYTGGEGFYAATYNPNRVDSSAALSSLQAGYDINMDYTADFFCLNEVRLGYDSSMPVFDLPKYRMEAVIDNPYLSVNGSGGSAMRRLEGSDYRISAYNLSIVDARGSWSKTSDGNLNIGWFEFSQPDFDENIYVYGSRSASGESDWVLIDEVSASSVWAVNGDRGFTSGYTWLDTSRYLRLKVTYDSRLTTALRVGYRLELNSDGPTVSSAVANTRSNNASMLPMTVWLRYTAYSIGTNGSLSRNLEFPIWAVVDDDNTIREVRTFDRTWPAYGYGGLSSDDSANGYPCRNFVRSELGKTDDAAGMILGRTLYSRSNGTVDVVGDRTSGVVSDSYAHRNQVNNLSEVVYNIAGAVVSGADNLTDLESRIDMDRTAGLSTAYTSFRQRFYVLLPEGLKLNTAPDAGSGKVNGAAGVWYVSPYSTYYNQESEKSVYSGFVDVPASDVSVPGLSVSNDWGGVVIMYWGHANGDSPDGDVVSARTYGVGNRQLVVFERVVYDTSAPGATFNLWGGANKRCFWGRGLSFSAVPVNNGEGLPSGTYKADFWCQFLDESGNPLAVDNYARELPSDAVTLFNKCASSAGFETDTSGRTLLYIDSSFTNMPVLGGSFAKLRVRSGETGFYDVSADTETGGVYGYAMTYGTDGIDTSDVVLWSNLENCNCGNEDLETAWHGAMTGIDLNGNDGARVFVNASGFNPAEYSGRAGSDWLVQERGWIEVTNPESYDGWSDAKALAVWFDGMTFSNSGQSAATVYVGMRAPELDGDIAWDGDETTYWTHNELLFSDSHKTSSDGGEQKGCAWASPVRVSLTGERPVTGGPQLPGTGGPGPGGYYKFGVAFLALACLLAINRDKTRRKRYFC